MTESKDSSDELSSLDSSLSDDESTRSKSRKSSRSSHYDKSDGSTSGGRRNRSSSTRHSSFDSSSSLATEREARFSALSARDSDSSLHSNRNAESKMTPQEIHQSSFSSSSSTSTITKGVDFQRNQRRASHDSESGSSTREEVEELIEEEEMKTTATKNGRRERDGVEHFMPVSRQRDGRGGISGWKDKELPPPFKTVKNGGENIFPESRASLSSSSDFSFGEREPHATQRAPPATKPLSRTPEGKRQEVGSTAEKKDKNTSYRRSLPSIKSVERTLPEIPCPPSPADSHTTSNSERSTRGSSTSSSSGDTRDRHRGSQRQRSPLPSRPSSHAPYGQAQHGGGTAPQTHDDVSSMEVKNGAAPFVGGAEEETGERARADPSISHPKEGSEESPRTEENFPPPSTQQNLEAKRKSTLRGKARANSHHRSSSSTPHKETPQGDEEKQATEGQEEKKTSGEEKDKIPEEYEDDYEEEDEEEEKVDEEEEEEDDGEDESIMDPFFRDRRRRAAFASQSSGYQVLQQFVAFGDVAGSARSSKSSTAHSAGRTLSQTTHVSSLDTTSRESQKGNRPRSSKKQPQKGRASSPDKGKDVARAVKGIAVQEEQTTSNEGVDATPNSFSPLPLTAATIHLLSAKTEQEEKVAHASDTATFALLSASLPLQEEEEDSSSVFSTISQHLRREPTSVGAAPVVPIVDPKTGSAAESSTLEEDLRKRKEAPTVASNVTGVVVPPLLSMSSSSMPVPTGATPQGVSVMSPVSSARVTPAAPLLWQTPPMGCASSTPPVGQNPGTNGAPTVAFTAAGEGAARGVGRERGMTEGTASAIGEGVPPPSTSPAFSPLTNIPSTAMTSIGMTSRFPTPKYAGTEKQDLKEQQEREWRLSELCETSKAVERLVGAFATLKGYPPGVHQKEERKGEEKGSSTPYPRVVKDLAHTSAHKAGACSTQQYFSLPSRVPYVSMRGRRDVLGVTDHLYATPMSVLHPFSHGKRDAARGSGVVRVEGRGAAKGAEGERSVGCHQMEEMIVQDLIRDIVVKMLTEKGGKSQKKIDGGQEEARVGTRKMTAVGEGEDASSTSPTPLSPAAFSLKTPAAADRPHEVVSSDDFLFKSGIRRGDWCRYPNHRFHSSRLPASPWAANRGGRQQLPMYGGRSGGGRPLSVFDDALHAFSLLSGTPDEDADADRTLQEAIKIALEKYFWRRVLPSCGVTPNVSLPPYSSIANHEDPFRNKYTNGKVSKHEKKEGRKRRQSASRVASDSSPLASLAPLISPYVAWVLLLDIIGVCRDIVEYGLLFDASSRGTSSSCASSYSPFGFPVLVQFTGPASMEELARATMHCLPFEVLETSSSSSSSYLGLLTKEAQASMMDNSPSTRNSSVFRLEYWVSRERLFSVMEAVESSLREHFVRDAEGLHMFHMEFPYGAHPPHGRSTTPAFGSPSLVLDGDSEITPSLCMPHGVSPPHASYFMVMPPSLFRIPRSKEVSAKQVPPEHRGAVVQDAERDGKRRFFGSRGGEWQRKTRAFIQQAEQDEREHLFGIGEDAVERISHVVSCVATDILTKSEQHHPTSTPTLEAVSSTPSPSPLIHLEKAEEFPLLCRMVAETTEELFADVRVRRALERRTVEKLKEYYSLQGTYATSSRLAKEKVWIQRAEEEAQQTVDRILQELKAQKIAEARAVYPS